MAFDFDNDEKYEDKFNESVSLLSMRTKISLLLNEVYDKQNRSLFRYYLDIAPFYFSCSSMEEQKDIMARFPVPVTSIPSTSKYENQVEGWKIIDEEMKEKWEKENSQFKANILELVQEHFDAIKEQLELSLNTARDARMLPEFAYYTALKWAFMKEKGLAFSEYMSLLNMPIKEFVSVKELYGRIKVMYHIFRGSIYNEQIILLLYRAYHQLMLFQYDIE